MLVPKKVLEQCEADAAKADRYDKMLEAAQANERRAQRCEGALDLTSGKLETCRSTVDEHRRQRNTWRVLGLSAGGLAFLSSFVLLGDMTSWWDL